MGLKLTINRIYIDVGEHLVVLTTAAPLLPADFTVELHNVPDWGIIARYSGGAWVIRGPIPGEVEAALPVFARIVGHCGRCLSDAVVTMSDPTPDTPETRRARPLDAGPEVQP